MISRIVKGAAATGFGLLMAAAPMVAPVAQAKTVTPGPESAYSYEWQNGVASSGPSGLYVCATTTGEGNTGARACYKPDGDKIYVEDTRADGYSAVMRWTTDYGRWGACRNSRGAGHWVVCDKNFAEGHVLQFHAARYNGETKKWVGQESGTVTSST